MRAKHAGGDAGYEAAGDESLAEYAEVIAEARDDVAFAGGESAEAGAGDFFGGFAVGAGGGDVGLASDFGEFGFGGAGAEGADADAVGLHFFGEAFGKEKVEGFGGGVRGDVGNALEGGSGGDDQDVAVTAGDHFREVEAGEVDYGGAVDLDHIEKTGLVGFGEFAVDTEAGVVDEEVDGEGVVFCELEDFFGGVGLGEVGYEDFCLDLVSGRESCG
jgi:hypothetical protein